MTSPIKLLHEGIVQGNWQKVCQGFEGLTGTKLAPPAQSASAEKALGAIGKLLQEYFSPGDPPDPGSDDFEDCQEEADDTPYDFGELDQQYGSHIKTGVDVARAEEMKKKRQQAKREVWEDDSIPFEPRGRVAQSPPDDPVSVRARQVRDEAKGIKQPEDPYAQFRVQHKGTQGDKNYTRGEEVTPGMSNNWKDNRKLATQELKDSIRLSREKEPEPRRDPARMVRVNCGKCGEDFDVSPIFAPRKIRGEITTFVCDGCIKRTAYPRR